MTEVEKKKRAESEGVTDGVSANIPFLLNANCVTQDGWSLIVIKEGYVYRVFGKGVFKFLYMGLLLLVLLC